MNPESPLESLFSVVFGMLEGTRGLQTGVGLAAFSVLAVLWLACRNRETGRRFGGAIAFLATAFALETVIPWVPPRWRVAVGLRAFAMLALFFGLVRALVVSADVLALRRRAHFSTIFRDLVTLFLYGVVVLVVFRVTLNFNVTPLLATSALVTAVIGLALQETLGNIFSGLALQLQKPFDPGDWVRFGNYLGRVQGIGWRSTRLITRSLELLEVPNALLAKDVITNYRGIAIGDELFVGISYSTPPNRVKEVVLGVFRHNPEIASQPSPQALVIEYGDFAIKYRIRFWMVDYSRQDQVRDEIMTSLWYAFRRNGIEIPYPIRTLYMHEVGRGAAGLDDRQQQQVAALRQVDFLSELSEDELAVLLPNLREAEFGRGEVICREGEPGETFFVLRQGTVEIRAHAPSGRETHVADLRTPAFFGEMSLLTGEPRSATVRAKSDTRLLVVERHGFEQLFQSRPAFAEEVCRLLAERQSDLREHRDQAPLAESSETRTQRLLAKMRSIFRF